MSDDKEKRSLRCGLLNIRPQFLQKFNSAKWFFAFFCLAFLVHHMTNTMVSGGLAFHHVWLWHHDKLCYFEVITWHNLAALFMAVVAQNRRHKKLKRLKVLYVSVNISTSPDISQPLHNWEEIRTLIHQKFLYYKRLRYSVRSDSNVHLTFLPTPQTKVDRDWNNNNGDRSADLHHSSCGWDVSYCFSSNI